MYCTVFFSIFFLSGQDCIIIQIYVCLFEAGSASVSSIHSSTLHSSSCGLCTNVIRISVNRTNSLAAAQVSTVGKLGERNEKGKKKLGIKAHYHDPTINKA